MRLQDEYFKRHNIAGVPLVKHCLNGCVLLRGRESKWNYRWLIATISWEPDPDQPGKYNINYTTPIHDGGSKGNLLSLVSKFTVQWDEYEDFLLKWSERIEKFSPITDQKEMTLAAWEMFVFCFDSWFQRQPYDFKEKMLYSSIDDQLSLEERFASYQDVMIHLTSNNPGIMRAWKYEMLSPIISNYSEWLATLILNNKKQLN